MKYKNVNDSVTKLFYDIQRDMFPELSNAKFLLLECTKKRKHKGNIVLGSIQTANDMMKFLTKDQAPDEGYDYVVILDGMLITYNDESALTRVIRHELRHCFVDLEAKKPYKIVDHDFSDFIAEIELNKDNPRWSIALAEVISDMYEEDDE
jgi:hypothetical protein